MKLRCFCAALAVSALAGGCSDNGAGDAESPAGAAAEFPRYEFTTASWPGSAEQAALLDAEARDAEWATLMEQALTDGLRGLDEVDYAVLRIECRTTLCGIAIDFAIFDPLSEKYTETRLIRERFLGRVRQSTERIGIEGLRYDFSAAYGADGRWTGKVGITVRRRAPTEQELRFLQPSTVDATE